MKEHIGRQNELGILESRWNSGKFEFGVIYGRRRVGKTYLIHKFLNGKRKIYFQATKDKDFNIRRFSRVIGEELFGITEIMPFTSFSTAFSVIAEYAEKERIALVIDEISYLAESDETFLSVLQSFIDQDFEDTGLFLILCGSNINFMENNLLGIKSPVYGRRTFQIKLLPFNISDTAEMLKGWSFDDVSAAHVITGGIPYYLSFINEHKDLKEALKHEFFLPGGRLYTEGRLYLMMEFRSVNLYDTILGLIASGVNDVSKISDESGKNKSIISQALQKLNTLGIVRKRTKIAGSGISKGWVFADRYFQFLYQYVYPFMEMIELGTGKSVFLKALSDLSSFVEKGIEDTFRKYVLSNSGFLITEIGNVEFADYTTKRNEEIAMVALTSDGKLLLGESKWRTEAVGLSEYNELVRRCLTAYPSAEQKYYFLLSRSGFKENLRMLADNSNGTIVLINGEDLLGK